ncbi:MAG TPA: hypothetical protein PLE77_03415 [Kiritimatiellia bacterium]|nr:hypothetical protein [Kiritimatiellia bacterium]
MRRLYVIFRVIAYLTGFVGMILFTLGRQADTGRTELTLSGGILLITAFVAFFCTYILYILNRLMKHPKLASPSPGPESKRD